MVAQPKVPELSRPAGVPAAKLKGSRARLIRRTDREWLSLFVEHNRSGLSLADYCKPKGMSPTSFSTKRTTLLKKYGIKDLDSLDLNNIDFSKSELGERKESENYELKEMDSISVENSRSKDKTGSELEIVFKHYSIKVPMNHDHEWVIGLLQKLMKINSEMED